MRDSSYLIGNKFAIGNTPNSTSFQKGNAPWNRGMKGIHLSPSTQFKPGQPSDRAMPEGSITLRRTKKGALRRFIKTAEGWTEYAKWLWIQEYGVLLAGDVVHHLNGDRLADTPSNLVAIPRTVHPTIHNRWGVKEPTQEQLRLLRERYRSLT